MKRILAALQLAAWAAACAHAAAPLSWRAGTEVASGRGERGPWRMNESRFEYVDDPSVGIDARGDVLVVWVDQARKDVFFQRFSATGAKRGGPVNVSRSPEIFSWLPRIALSPREPSRVFVLWQEIIFSGGSHGGEILFADSEDGGKTFSRPLNLSNSRAGDGKGRIDRDTWDNGSLDLAVGSDGAILAAWTNYEGALWFSRRGPSAKRFSTPLRIAGSDDRPARAPSLAQGPGGDVYLAWTVGEDAAADIRVAASSDGGSSFGEPQVVASSPRYSDAPKLAVDARGVLHLVYGERSGGRFGPSRIRYTRSSDGARTFEPPRDISGPRAGYPALSVAGSSLYVLWEHFPEPHERARGLAVVVSRDGGRSFSDPEVVPGSIDPAGGVNGSLQGRLMRKLAVDSRGAIAIVNSSFEPNERSRVWLILGADPHAAKAPSEPRQAGEGRPRARSSQ